MVYDDSVLGINRIRLEFKDKGHHQRVHEGAEVLIESDWNLKERICRENGDTDHVLIESDWNLKGHS